MPSVGESGICRHQAYRLIQSSAGSEEDALSSSCSEEEDSLSSSSEDDDSSDSESSYELSQMPHLLSIIISYSLE